MIAGLVNKTRLASAIFFVVCDWLESTVSSSIWNYFTRVSFLKNSQVQIDSKLNEKNNVITYK